ncbi:MAG: hypothetical protein PHS41_00780 [Victivallaceae bacterium]|nr:hypothetical protein [Victivallaceae bacterium]
MGKSRYFVDGVESVGLSDGVVRMECFNNEPQENGEVKHLATTQINMTPQGFLRAFQSMENLINQLVAAGVVTRKTPGDAGKN